MQSNYAFYVLVLVSAAFLGGYFAAYARQRWNMPAARPFAFLMGCVGWWGLFAALSAIVEDGDLAALLGVQFRFTGVVLVAPAALLFALAYNGRTEWLRPRRVGLILVVPLVSMVLNWTAGFHDLFVYDVLYEQVGGIWLRTAWNRGAWFRFIYNPFSYGLLVVTLVLLANGARRSRYPYRQQAYLIFIGGLVPLVASVPATFDLLPGPDLDLIVMGFLVMGLMFGWGLSRYHLLDVMPIARSTILENMFDPMLILDNEDRVVELNPALYKRLDLSRREAIGLNLEQVFERWPDLLEKYQRIEEGQLVISVPANNRIYYFDVRISPIHKEGRRAGRLIVWRDITQVKETELALEASLRRTESLYEVAESVSGIVPLDELFEVVVEKVAAALPADRVTLIVFDQAAEQITNFVAGGPGLAEVKRVSYGELMEGLSGWVLRQRRPTLSVKGEPDTRESADVQRRRLETNAGSIIVVPILYRERILGTITAIKRPEEPDFEEADVDLLEAMANQVAVAIENYQLYEAQVEQVAELKESNDALQAFSHMVAHDLKGPLSVMIGYGEILLGNSGAVQIPDSELRHYASIIYGTSRKMSTIINDLLLLARIRRQEEAPLKGLDMVTILEEVLGRLEFEIEQAEAKIYYPDVWPEVVGYGPWVEEIWVNYITNALKYGGEEPKVELGWDRAVEGDIRFWVRDWGMGISTGEQEKLFVEFSRVEERKIKGYGLGLSIVRRVVERMGGMAGVESELGAGSRFWFTLREKNNG